MRRGLERGPADVDENATRGVDQGVQELLGLETDAGSELDEGGVRADDLDHLVHRGTHDPELGPRGIVLRELGDGLEQPRAERIIEVLAGQLLGCASKPLQRFGSKIAELRMEVDDADALLGAE